MSVRLTWTNISSGHDGTYVYRSTLTMDPQALPAPVADLPAGSEEYIDGGVSGGTRYYRVQDHEGGSVSLVSDEFTIEVPIDWSSASVGDEIDGGIYAGTITYADAREFHLIFGKQESEASGLQWGNNGVVTGATSPDDGLANQNDILNNHDDGNASAFYHCRDYVDGSGNSDYYLPASNELAKADALVNMGHSEFSTSLSSYRRASTETSDTLAVVRRFSDGNQVNDSKSFTGHLVRPIRRIAV